MKRHPRAQSEYLPPEYNEALEPLQSIVENLEFPPSNVNFRQVIHKQWNSTAAAQFAFQRFTVKETKSVPKRSKTIDEFDTFLRFGALKAVGKDLMFRQILQTLAGAASEAVSEGDTDASEHAVDIAGAVIDYRAINTAFSLLDAHNLTYMVFDKEDRSVWDRSVAAHERQPRIKPPAYIGDREGDEFWTILQRQKNSTSNIAKPVIKPSRSKIITGLRLARSINMMGHVAREGDPIAVHINSIGELVTRTLVINRLPLEITPKEIIRSMQTALKARRYMDSAANLDSSVSSDPAYAYVSYLGQQLGGYDSSSELAVFNRDVRRKAKNNK